MGEPDLWKSWWDAPYFFDLPYVPGYGWAAGDRCAYRSVYGFLVEGGEVVEPFDDGRRFDLQGETAVIGRFSATRLPDAAYIRVNDGFMMEGQRHFDGTFDPLAPGTGEGSQQRGFDECPDPDEAYDPYTGPDERPVVVFWTPGGEVAEIRDYRTTETGEGIIFHLVDADGSDGRVGVLAVDSATGLPAVVVYYDALGAGSVTAHLTP